MNVQTPLVTFALQTSDPPPYELGWAVEKVSDNTQNVWRVSIHGSPSTAQPFLNQQAIFAQRWEAYAEQVATKLREPFHAVIASYGEVALDLHLRLLAFLDRELQRTVRVETVVDGTTIAATVIDWQDGQWTNELQGEESLELMVHHQLVETVGTFGIAYLRHESAVAAAVRKLKREQDLHLTAWQTVQGQIRTLAAPVMAPLMTPPIVQISLPYIVPAQALEFDWCWVPAGPFTIGGDGEYDGKPIHEVNVDAFWMARHPVTNVQFRQFMQAGGYADKRWWTKEGWKTKNRNVWKKPRYWDDTQFNGAQQPVVGVSWHEAIAFCAWASEITEQEIRLPTEAEWEKAARGTDGHIYAWGNETPNEKLCNFGRNVGQTTPVGRYSPQGDSPHGCTDMTGNVREWCMSKNGNYPYYAEDGRNTQSGTDHRVVRGGSWNNYNDYILRAANRIRDTPDYRYRTLGFRCASTPF